jgi:hypothetical protein
MTLHVFFKRFTCYNESEEIHSNHFLVLNSQVTACVEDKLSSYAECLILAQRRTNKCSSTQSALQRHFIFSSTNLAFSWHRWAPSKLPTCPSRNHFSELHKAETNFVNNTILMFLGAEFILRNCRSAGTKEIPVSYRTRRFTTEFIRAHHLTLS